MKDIQTTLGIPDTLPPPCYGELRGPFWFAGFGLLLVLLGLFHNAVAFRIVLVGWMALPVLGWLRRLAGGNRTVERPMPVQVWIYACLVVGLGIAFTLWARHLGLAWPVVIGTLFLMEGMAGAIASLTEWWRLSLCGHSAGLIISGFAIPFVDKSRAGVLVGGALLFGSLLSGGILYWQLRRHRASAGKSPEPVAVAGQLSN